MKVKRVTIESISPYPKGKAPSGKACRVFGGHLFKVGDKVDVVPYGKNNEHYILNKLNYQSADHFYNHFDKDGLVEFGKLQEVKQKSRERRRVYELDGFWVFPENKIISQVDFLYENRLIESARLRISNYKFSVSARAQVYGPDYQQMILDVIESKKSVSSWFICERRKKFDENIYADLFILTNWNDSYLQIQLWQIIGEGDEVLYAHGLMESESLQFIHFDLATHYVNPSELPRLIYKKQRIRIQEKRKWLRLDGNIPQSSVFELIKMFFPLDRLVDEFREIRGSNEE